MKRVEFTQTHTHTHARARAHTHTHTHTQKQQQQLFSTQYLPFTKTLITTNKG